MPEDVRRERVCAMSARLTSESVAYILVVFSFWNINRHIHKLAKFKRNSRREKIFQQNPMVVKIQQFSVSEQTLVVLEFTRILECSHTHWISDRNGTRWKLQKKIATKNMLLRSTYYYSFEPANSPSECASTHGCVRMCSARVECADAENWN